MSGKCMGVCESTRQQCLKVKWACDWTYEHGDLPVIEHGQQQSLAVAGLSAGSPG